MLNYQRPKGTNISNNFELLCHSVVFRPMFLLSFFDINLWNPCRSINLWCTDETGQLSHLHVGPISHSSYLYYVILCKWIRCKLYMYDNMRYWRMLYYNVLYYIILYGTNYCTIFYHITSCYIILYYIISYYISL